MGSDVEDLRDLWADLSREIVDKATPEVLRCRSERQRAALSSAISALEALERQGVIVATGPASEAQPKVEWRPDDRAVDRLAVIAAETGDARSLLAEARRARASEAALRQELDDVRVGLSGAVLLPGFRPDSLGSLVLSERTRLRDALAREAALSERVEHIAQALGVVVDRIDADQYDTKAAIARDIIAALRPPSKPETP